MLCKLWSKNHIYKSLACWYFNLRTGGNSRELQPFRKYELNAIFKTFEIEGNENKFSKRILSIVFACYIA